MIDRKSKIEKIREFIRENEIDAIIVSSWQNVFLLSGFTGYGDAVLLVTLDKLFIFTDSRYFEQAKQESPDFELVKTRGEALKNVDDVLKKYNIERTGFENLAVSYREFNDILMNFSTDLYEIDDIFEKIREIKTEDEIKAIEKACNVAMEAYNRILPKIKPGVSEIEVAAALEYEMRVLGAEKPAFDTVVASGVRGCMPHGTASNKIIEYGDAVTLDFGAFVDGYCSDMTRTVFVGEAEGKVSEIYDIVLEAQCNAIKSFEYGMLAGDMDKVARKIINDRQYGRYFGHALGHGVGIDVHEDPVVYGSGKTPLTEGMIFSIEPGIYIPDVGGVRIEDLAVVENGKLKIFTAGLSKEKMVVN